MYKKILVALDHSEHCSSVFERALDLASTSGASLMLAHVLADEDGGLALPYPSTSDGYSIGLSATAWEAYASRWQKYEEEGLKRLRDYQQQAKQAGVKAEFSQNSGPPGRRICDIALMWNADLIVVGSRRRRGLSELLLGSVSNYVIHHAPCSVLMAHPARHETLESSETKAMAQEVGQC